MFTYTKMAKDSPATYYQIDEESHSKDEKNETIWTQTIEKSLWRWKTKVSWVYKKIQNMVK